MVREYSNYMLYILAAIVVIITTIFTYNIISSFIAARRAEPRHQLILVANEVYYADTDFVASVHISDLEGQPLKADFSVYMEHVIYPSLSFSTDYYGRGTIVFPISSEVMEKEGGRSSGGFEMHIVVESELGIEYFQRDINIAEGDGQDFIVHFDKGLYNPGDDVLFRVLALSSTSARPLARRSYTVSIFDGNDNRVYRENAVASDFGIISGRFRLADEVNSGLYRLEVEYDGVVKTYANFEVRPFVLPRFEINLETDRDEYSVGETIYLTGNVRYFFGEPVNQGTVNIYINGEPELTAAPLDENGEFTLSHVAQEPGLFHIWVEVIDNSNYRVETALSVWAAEGAFVIDLMPEHGYLVQGMANVVYVFTSHGDGTPVRAHMQITGQGFSRQVATNEDGIGTFILEGVEPVNLITVRATDMDGNDVQQEFIFDGIIRNVTLSTDRPRYAMGETIYLDLNRNSINRDSFGDGMFVIYAYKNNRLLQIISTEHDRAELKLGDIYGLIDIYAIWVSGTDSFSRYENLLYADHWHDLASGTSRFGNSSENLSSGSLPHARRTVFIDPGSFMQLTLQNNMPEYRPGEFVNLSIGVTDDRGTPLEAALLVSIVDEAMLSIAANDLSIDNIRLALDGIRFSEGLDAATLYASLIAGASEQAITRLLLRQGNTVPLVQTARLINVQDNTGSFVHRISNLLRIYLLLLVTVLFFAIRQLHKRRQRNHAVLNDINDTAANDAAASDGASDVSDGGEKVAFWSVITSIVVFILALIFLSSCGAMQEADDGRVWDRAPEAPAEAPMAADDAQAWDRAPEAPAAAAPFMPDNVQDAQVNRAEMERREAGQVNQVEAAADAELGVWDMGAGELETQIETQVENQIETQIETQQARVRRLFLETMLFVPELIAQNGHADLSFMLADNITTWNIQVVGNTKEGIVGHTQGSLRAFQPFFVDFELPRNSIRGDQISIPVTVFNYTEEEQTVILTIAEMDWFTLHTSPVHTLTIPSNQSQMVYIPITILQFGDFVFRAYADTHNFADAAERGLRVNPEGFRISQVVSSGRIEASTWQHLLFMQEDIDDTRSATVKFYPSAMAQIVEGMENIFRMPTGCFEQISSTLYPNILALRYMQDNNIDNPTLTETALRYISSGYQQLLTYEVRQERGGFSLYGHAPAETVLTAYGLMQLKDLSSIYPVDERVIDRMAEFLFANQNNDGSFQLTGRHMNRISDRERLAFNAYIVWAISEAFPSDPRLDEAIDFLTASFDIVDDNYTLALIANALVNTSEYINNANVKYQVIDRLHSNIIQSGDIAFVTSNTRDFLGASGHMQDLQATALTSLVFSNSDTHPSTNNMLIDYIISQRDPWGTWHSTQATILCLKALVTHDTTAHLEEGQITVTIGNQHQVIDISKDNTLDFYAVTFNGLTRENIIDINFPNLGRMVYKFVQEFYAPFDSVELDRGFEITASMNTELAVHQRVEQELRIVNSSGSLVKNALAAISIPQGFTVERSSLAYLQHQGIIERYETRFDTINLYLRDIEPGEITDIVIAYRPSFPVNITGGHVRVFDYYNPTIEGFLEPIGIRVQ